MIGHYIRTSTSLRYYLPDWILSGGLLVFFFLVLEHLKPFERKFSTDNPNLQFPFAEQERVTDNQLYILSFFLPWVTIILVSLYQKRKSQLSQYDWLNLVSISTLGLLLSFTITACVTDILKVWIARPRPDFLSRCGARKGTDATKLVGFEVCTMPFGEAKLFDGMKSTPSGHSSVSFAGLLYLSLWLVGQFKLSSGHRVLVSSYFIPALPILLATYISLSRAQDYRHHFFDIVFGGAIGIAIGSWNYFKLFPSLLSEATNEAKVHEKQGPILP